MRRKEKQSIVNCGKVFLNDGREERCSGVPMRRNVYLICNDGRSVQVCSVIVCSLCLRAFKDKNGHTLTIGPSPIKKCPGIESFDIPFSVFKGDWPYRQKFAWLIQKGLDEDPNCLEFKESEIADKLGFAPVEKEDANRAYFAELMNGVLSSEK